MTERRSTSESDYRLYSRPLPGESGDWVEVVDDGEPQQSSDPATPNGAAEFSEAGVASAGADGRLGPAAPQRRFNPYLCAAWAVVALMLVLGLIWLSGNFQMMTAIYGSTGPTMSRQDVMAMNFQMMGVYLLPFGLAGALALLILQAAGYRGEPRD